MTVSMTAMAEKQDSISASQSVDTDHAWMVTTLTLASTVIAGLKSLDAKQIDLYTINALFTDLPQVTGLSHVNVHLDIRSSYPERRLFKQSKAITERLITQLGQVNPAALKVCDIAHNRSIDFYDLAVRRMVISHIYFELCYCRWMIEEFKSSDATKLLVLSAFLQEDDFQELLHDIPASKSIEFRVEDHYYNDYAQTDWLHRLFPVNNPAKVGLSLLKYPTRYLAFLYHEVNNALVNLLVCSFPRLTQRMFSRKLTCYNRLKADDNRIHVVSGSLSRHNLHYYSMVYVPLFKKLIEQGYAIQYCFFHFETRAEADAIKFLFLNRLSEYGVPVEHVTVSYISYDESKMIQTRFLSNFSTAQLNVSAIVNNTSLSLYQKCTLTMLDQLLDVYRCMIMNWLLYHQANPMRVLLALEHDLDEASLLKRLSLLVTPDKPLTNIILPSCLPEYSEVYDCVDVDTLYTHHKQIEKIFTDQAINARDLRVSGSTEWEEQPPESAKFDDETQALIDRSDIVLGVFHQPLFLSFHQKEIYDGLIVDFKSIYERFLIEHPNGCMLIKPHRADDLEAMREFIPQSDRIRILAKDCSNQLLYRSIDVALSIHSTTVVHTIAHGIPMLCLYKYPDYTHFYDLVDQMGCLATNTHDALFEWLHKFTSDDTFKANVLSTLHAYRDHNKTNPASTVITQQITELMPLN